MPEMVSYVFGTLERHDIAIGGLVRHLKQQNKFNRAVVTFSMVTVLHVVATNKALKKQREQIKKLNDEIEKLKESTESES